MKWFLFALLTLGSPQQESQCFRNCTDCNFRCKRASAPETCRQACFEIKKACCQSCGSGPGPHKVCMCT
jgi:hypothetical protein